MTLAPKTVREQVTNQIRDDLVSGRYEPDTMLREIELAKRLGVSRGPVRDAFIQLSHEGFLEYYANRGVMVRHPPNPEDHKFITSIRQQIEIHVLGKGLASLTDESIRKVESALQQLKEACDSNEASEVALKDIAFHRTILIACGGEDLVGAWRQLCSRMLFTYTRLRDFDEGYREHVAIFEALSSRDLESTIAAIKANIK
jgi:DNA-binding GntR family transcriptional regulator